MLDDFRHFFETFAFSSRKFGVLLARGIRPGVLIPGPISAECPVPCHLQTVELFIWQFVFQLADQGQF